MAGAIVAGRAGGVEHQLSATSATTRAARAATPAVRVAAFASAVAATEVHAAAGCRLRRPTAHPVLWQHGAGIAAGRQLEHASPTIVGAAAATTAATDDARGKRVLAATVSTVSADDGVPAVIAVAAGCVVADEENSAVRVHRRASTPGLVGVNASTVVFTV